MASQFDVGTAPNKIPLNQYLGSMAYQDSDNVSVGSLVTSGNVSVGTTSSNFSTFNTSANGIVIKSPNTYGLIKLGGATGDFYVASGSSGAAWLWNVSNTEMRFGTNNTERMRIDSSGNLLIGSTSNSGGRLQVTTDSTNFISNANGIYRVFTRRISKASNTTSTCAITFGYQGNQHASHIVEVFFAAAQDDANGGVGGRATFMCSSLTGVGNVSEIQDIGTGTSFTTSTSGDVLTITATTTSNRNVVAWTVKVTSTFDGAAPTQIVVA
jgi:hypothetical protein